jgi:uncharacterized protein YndB with AHSA1/START domain
VPPTGKTLTETKTVIDRETHSIIFTRSFAAPCERIFEAWTRPEHVAKWWDSSGDRLAECTIDLRPGGAFKLVSARAADFPPFGVIYREIKPPDHLVFEAMGAVGKVLFQSVSGGTRMIVRIECGSAAQLENFVKMGVDAGTSQTLDNLVAYIGAMQE